MPTDSFVDLEFKGILVNVRKSQVQNAVDAIEKRITEPVSVNCLIGPVSVFSPWDTVEDITIKVIQNPEARSIETPHGPYEVREKLDGRAWRFGVYGRNDLPIAWCASRDEASQVAAALNKAVE